MPLKKIPFFVVTIIFLMVTSALGESPLIIRFSHVVAENTPKGQMANHFRDLIAERLPGKVEVIVYPDSKLVGDEMVLQAMILGDVQMAAPSISIFKKYAKSLQLFDLPFLFRNIDAVDRFQQSEAGQHLLHSISAKGFVGLGYLHNGMKQLSASKILRVPANANGLKFRIMSSKVLASQFLALNATPLNKPFSEVFNLLRTGAIDGQENTWSNIYSKKFYELQPYITESDHGVLDYLVVTSREFWRNLPDDIRPTIKKSLDEAIAFGNKIAREKAISDRQKIVDSGLCQIITLTDEERQLWVDTMQPVWKQFENQIGSYFIEAARRANN